MLSRVAESIYWMSRYIERAENVARFVDVNLNLMLDFPGSSDQQWQPLVDITGDTEDFAERYGEASQGTRHPLPDLRHQEPQLDPVVRARRARERAFGARDHLLGDVGAAQSVVSDAHGRGSTSPRDQRPARAVLVGEDGQPGLHRHHRYDDDPQRGLALLPPGTAAGARRQDVAHPRRQVLPAAAEGGRRRHDRRRRAVGGGAALGQRVRDVPQAPRPHLADRASSSSCCSTSEFPRAIHHCVEGGARIACTRSPGRRPRCSAARSSSCSGLLCSELAYAQVDEIIAGGLHEYLDGLQTKMNQVGIAHPRHVLRRTGRGARSGGRRAAPASLRCAVAGSRWPSTSRCRTPLAIATTGRSRCRRTSSGCGRRRTAARRSSATR